MNGRMESLAPWAVTACGVDWNGGTPIAVGARLRRGRVVCMPLTPEAAAIAQGDAKTAVSGALPPGRAMAVWLQTPLASPAKARRVLPTLLDMAMPFALEECIYAFSPLVHPAAVGDETLPGSPDGAGKLAALAVAARRGDVAAQLAVFAEKGIDPHVLDHEGLALWTEAQRTVPATGAAGVRAVVWVRRGEALLALGAGERFWSAHRIADMTSGTLERTVRVQLDSVAGGRYANAPLTWMWGGTATAACAALRTRLEAALPSAASVSLPNGEAFLAGALAVRALTDGPLQFNLRGGALAHPAVQRQTDVQHRWRAGYMTAAALVLLAVNATCGHIRSQRLRQAEARFKASIDRVAGWPVPAAGENALLIAQRELEARQEAYRPVIRVFAPSLLETLAPVLAGAAESGAMLHSLLLRFDNLALRGQAPSSAAAEALARHIEKLGYSTELKAMPEAPDQAFGFEIRGVVKGQP